MVKSKDYWQDVSKQRCDLQSIGFPVNICTFHSPLFTDLWNPILDTLLPGPRAEVIREVIINYVDSMHNLYNTQPVWNDRTICEQDLGKVDETEWFPSAHSSPNNIALLLFSGTPQSPQKVRLRLQAATTKELMCRGSGSNHLDMSVRRNIAPILGI